MNKVDLQLLVFTVATILDLCFMLTLCYYSQNYSRIIIASLSATNATSYVPPFLRRNPHHFLQIRAFISPDERFVNLEYCLYTSNKLMYCMFLGMLSCKLSVTQSVLLCMCTSLLQARTTLKHCNTTSLSDNHYENTALNGLLA